MYKRVSPSFLYVLMTAFTLACGRDETSVDGAPAPEEMVTESTAAVARTGTWIDTLVAVEEPNADAAVTRLEAGDIDVYASTVTSAGTYQRVRESSALAYKMSFGSNNELTFNPAKCMDETRLNPFSVPKIREAMNWLVDRDYIVAELLGGMGTPRYVAISGASADRGRLAAEIRVIEAKYAYDLEKARAVVTEEMETLGATLEDGRWTYSDSPVELIGIIRSEDERTQIGDYFANQLEDIGFTIVRDYKTSSESTPIVYNSDPTECEFSFYTAGWVSLRVNRDASGAFSFFYTPAGLPRPLWQAYTPTEEFDGLTQRLRDSDYSSLDERAEMIARALPMSLENSVRIWLLDRSSVAPYRKEVEVSADLSGSIVGSLLWPYTLRVRDRTGGSLTWASSSILTDVWNPVAGTNWVFDSALIRATGQSSFIPDPNTGLFWPQRVEASHVTVKAGLPVGKTLDWVTLDFAPEIVVPGDAWVGWDAAQQRFITASEADTGTRTALLKVVTTYPDDLFQTIRWHDGSPLSLADMIMPFILFLDQGQPESPIYDEAQVPQIKSFMSTFKGLRVASTDPVVIEFYSDNWSLDAESASGQGAQWPSYGRGEAPWHTMGLAVAVEGKGLAAFSGNKAAEKKIEQFNYIAGPTLDILSKQLTESAEAGEIPYAPTLADYVTPEEVASRYANLQDWFDRRGHFWVGTGPFYLARAYPVEGTVILVRNPDFPDPADKWARFAEPAIAVVDIDGPGRVTPGEDAAFEISVSFKEKPYAVSDVQQVKYLVFDATGKLARTGTAEAVTDGSWRVDLPGDLTTGLEVGSNRLEVIIVSKLVALPSLAAYQFVTAP